MGIQIECSNHNRLSNFISKKQIHPNCISHIFPGVSLLNVSQPFLHHYQNSIKEKSKNFLSVITTMKKLPRVDSTNLLCLTQWLYYHYVSCFCPYEVPIQFANLFCLKTKIIYSYQKNCQNFHFLHIKTIGIEDLKCPIALLSKTYSYSTQIFKYEFRNCLYLMLVQYIRARNCIDNVGICFLSKNTIFN